MGSNLDAVEPSETVNLKKELGYSPGKQQGGA